ncbi:MAG: MBL fold metallo-hydrolase [Candidatus Lokiarchaeota archaeon]|nr:MBL fold metallo-hydrolase [Candidatus Lokiarchaeota archaeon]
MKITTIKQDGLAHLSYFVSSDDEAIVIDPRRDAQIYIDLANKHQVEIKYVFETHRNEDYVIGSLELQNRYPSLKIGHSKETKFKYGEIKLGDEDEFKVGSVKVVAMHTPGHTNDSMCYMLIDSSVSNDPIVIFTGDTLFSNEVGRTDLVDIKLHEEQSEKLYHSLTEKVMKLPDGVIVYPAHGAGSVCGGDIADRDFTTIGYERVNNVWLDMDESEFIEAKLNQGLILSPYFKRCEHLNTVGPELISNLPCTEAFTVDRLEEFLKGSENTVIDTHNIEYFMREHIPKTVSLSMDSIGLLAGWALQEKHSFVFVLDDLENLDEARASLLRVGLDNIVGYLQTGVSGWKKSGRNTESMKNYGLKELKELAEAGDIEIIDVRQPHEFESGHIESSFNAPLTHIREKMPKIDKSTPKAAICGVGLRSTTAASILKKNGFMNIGVPLDGLKGWMKKGYSLE